MKRPRTKFKIPALIVFLHKPSARLVVCTWSKTFQHWWVDAGKEPIPFRHNNDKDFQRMGEL